MTKDIALSVLIPSRNEQFLQKTVDDVLAKASGSIEVVTVLDGYWPNPPLKDDSRVIIIHRGESQGMRPAINSAASVAHGKYLLKCDAHVMFAEGFDDVLLSEIEDNWVVIPRRYSLDAENWCIKKDKPPIDYHYLSYPLVDAAGGFGFHGRYWRQRCEERKDILNDMEMTSQGSVWCMPRKHWDWLGGLHVEGYGDFIQEFQEVGMKTWLGGGEVRVNKKTWYAHLHKGSRYGRGYPVSRSSWHRGLHYSTDFWLNNRWKSRIHDFSWLIEKFAPIPTWPDDWQDRIGEIQIVLDKMRQDGKLDEWMPRNKTTA